jgi:hypothetical protein
MNRFIRLSFFSIIALLLLVAFAAGEQGNSASVFPVVPADGRYVAFESAASNLIAGDTNGMYDIFVRDRTTGTTWLVSKS